MEDLATELAQAIHDGKTSREEILSILTHPNCKVNDDTKISIVVLYILDLLHVSHLIDV
jgi:hypothetical protein